jgi:hypothetical protein
MRIYATDLTDAQWALVDRRAAAGLLGGIGPIFPTIATIIADAGHQSHKLTRLI